MVFAAVRGLGGGGPVTTDTVDPRELAVGAEGDLRVALVGMHLDTAEGRAMRCPFPPRRAPREITFVRRAPR